MKKKLIILVVLAVPALLYLNAWQAFRYEVAETETERLELEQQKWLEENKKEIVRIEVLGSPARIDGIAGEMEGLERSVGIDDIRIDIVSGGGDG